METSVSLLERLAGAPTDDDWRRLVQETEEVTSLYADSCGTMSRKKPAGMSNE